MLDIDVMDGEGTPVDRNALGLPPRRCFVCQQPAAACVARKIHTREEIDAQVEALRRAALEGLEETAP
jgi:phosphoribosyl-dephospho-CoA transferase